MTDAFAILHQQLADRYRLVRPIGAGGMASVFLAVDKHERQVAIKVLHPELTAALGAERFLQEIRVTAHLQHPHILPLYDSGTTAGLLYYVMPYVAGESLRAKLQREKQLPVDEAVRILKAVAGALDYAHRQGIVHRDIKPENILLSDGQALVADFGIALAVSAAAADRITRTGFSVGTPQYMSPEQGAGEPVDRRTDVYSLGAVGYEMLAGIPPHRGVTPQGVLAAALTTAPQPLTELRPTTPIPVAAAIHRALERLPADRFGSASEFAEALDRRAEPPVASSRKIGWWVAVAAALIGGLWLGRQLGPRQPAAQSAGPRRWHLNLPATAPIALTGPGPLGTWQSALALSPNGEWMVYVAPDGESTSLMLRRMDRDSIVPLPGTTGAYHPFFSADGAWIGFFTGAELKKIQRGGVSPVLLGRVNRPVGAVWTNDDRVVVIEDDGFTLRTIRGAGGGQDSSITLATQFGSPDLLPDERWAVGHLSSGQLALLSLTDGHQWAVTRRGVVPLDSVGEADLLLGMSPKWVPGSSHLVFSSGDGVLTALPFDGATRRVLGQPVPVISGVRIEEGFGYGEYAVAEDGTLIYVPGGHQNYGRIARINGDGTFDTLPFPREPYTQLRVSPDGRQLALQEYSSAGWEVSILDLVTGQRRRFPVEGWFRAFPAAWSPDGSHLLIGIWSAVQYLNYGARLAPVAGGPARALDIQGASYMSIAPNGEDLVYSDWRNGELFVRKLWDTTRTALPGRGFAASFSPDGKWVAWGALDGTITVSPLPPTGATFVASERGQQPLWSPDGRALIFRDGRRFYRVGVSTAGGFTAGPPTLIAEGPFVRTFAWNYTIGSDGRLITVVALPEKSRRDLSVVSGFPAELARVAPLGTR